MKTLTKTGGCTYDGTTVVQREVPVIKSFPSASGKAISAKIKTTLRVGASLSSNWVYTVYLFKTFNGDMNHWDERVDNLYQYPNNVSHHLTDAYIGNILASATFSEKLTYDKEDQIGDNVITKTLELTEYGEQVKNWAGDVYMAVIHSSSHSYELYWGNATTSTITLEYNNGIVRFATGGGFVDCEVYHAVNGSWQQVQAHYGANGAWQEVGK